MRKDWKKCRKQIQGIDDTLRTDLLDGIDETTFLTTVTLYTSYVDKQAGKDHARAVSCKKKDVLNLPYESYIANRDVVLDGYRIARNFLLQYQFVFRQRDLPYTTQLIPLAAICAYLGKVSVMKQIQLRFCLNGIGVEYLEKCMAVPMRPDMQMIWKML